MSFLGTAAQAYGQKLQGQEEQSALNLQGMAYDYNAQLADIQAKEAAVSGEIEQVQMAREEKDLASTQQAMYAKAGVMLEGSPLDVMLKSASDFEFDRSVQKYNTAIQVSNIQSQAAMDRYYGNVKRYEGKVARQQGKFKAATTIITGVGKMAEQAAFAAGGV